MKGAKMRASTCLVVGEIQTRRMKDAATHLRSRAYFYRMRPERLRFIRKDDRPF